MAKLPPPIKPTRSKNLCDTKAQARALATANRILAKSGFFKTVNPKDEDAAVDANACGTHGLRPTWHGKA